MNISEEKEKIYKKFKNLCKSRFSYFDFMEILKAIDFAEKSSSSSEKNSEDHFLHLIRTASTLLTLPIVTKEMIILALLHNTFYFGEEWIEKLQNSFDEEIFNLVKTYSEIGDKEIFVPNTSSDILIKFLVSRAKDLRILLVILANKIDNLSQGNYEKKEIQNKAKESLFVLAPIADRLGIGKFKFDLENLSLKFLHPTEYKWIENFVKNNKEIYEKFLTEAKDKIFSEMKLHKIKGEVSYRIKNIYSIYSKVVAKYGRDLRKISDFAGIRIIVSSISDCYKALSICSSLWSQEDEKFKDYIEHPKPNGYKSIHSVFKTDDGKSFEVQIRTEKMHEIAEFGLAARWKYNEFKKTSKYKEREKNINLKQKNESISEYLTKWESEILSEKFSSQKDSISQKIENVIFISTPKKDILELPKGSKVLDVAYKIHTKLGNKCIGAKINEKMVGIDYEVSDGDMVEIVTNDTKTHQTEGCLKFVKTPLAKKSIQNSLRKFKILENSKKGEELFDKIVLEKYGKEILKSAKKIISDEENFVGYKTKESFFAGIYEKTISIEKILKNFELISENEENSKNLSFLQKTEKKESPEEEEEKEILVGGERGIAYSFARCCNPKKEDILVGFLSKTNGAVLHKSHCKNLQKTNILNLVDISSKNNSIKNFGVLVGLTTEKDILEDIRNVHKNFVVIKKERIQSDYFFEINFSDFNSISEIKTFLGKIKLLKFLKNVEFAKFKG